MDCLRRGRAGENLDDRIDRHLPGGLGGGIDSAHKILAVLDQLLGLVLGVNTDDVPMHGTGEVKDNWDLSVMRATAVTKILLENKKINPVRIISAGRGKFVPIASGKTPEDRQKNRRTEIILSPRLDEIFKLLETN